jgi:hypothetical protein
MSNQAFVDFYGKYLESPAGEAARKQLDGIKDHNSFAERMVAVGAANGFQFTKDEVLEVMKASEAKAAKALAKASGELSEDQLEGVVGGAGAIGSIPTVSIGNIGSLNLQVKLNPANLVAPGAANMSTVMCPW